MEFKTWLQQDESLKGVGKWIAKKGLPLALQAYSAATEPVSAGMQQKMTPPPVVMPGADEYLYNRIEDQTRKKLQAGKRPIAKNGGKPGSIRI